MQTEGTGLFNNVAATKLRVRDPDARDPGQQNKATKVLRETKRNYKNTTTVGDFNAPLPKFGILNKQKISKNGENLSDQNNYLFLTFTECFTFFGWFLSECFTFNEHLSSFMYIKYKQRSIMCLAANFDAKSRKCTGCCPDHNPIKNLMTPNTQRK